MAHQEVQPLLVQKLALLLVLGSVQLLVLQWVPLLVQDLGPSIKAIHLSNSNNSRDFRHLLLSWVPQFALGSSIF
jgi:hypothetical protein